MLHPNARLRLTYIFGVNMSFNSVISFPCLWSSSLKCTPFLLSLTLSRTNDEIVHPSCCEEDSFSQRF